MQLTNKQEAGFTLVEIMIVVAIIGLLAAVAIPNFVKARTTSQKNACIKNLQQIEGAIAAWSIEKKKKGEDQVVTAEIYGSDTAHIKATPSCPSGGNYTITTVSVRPDCDAPGHDLP